MESKGGEAVVGSDGGRGSYGGEREWCRVLERVNSPGLIVAHVCTLLPMSACCCPYLHVVSCVHMSLPMSLHLCSCPHIISHVHASLPMSTCCCLHLQIVALVPM